MKLTQLDGKQLRQAILAGAKYLEERKSAVDALNVFPVPDGDTGTNMSMTLRSAAKEVEKTAGHTVGEVGEALSRGSLMGARGNSGVILSQLFRGFARGLADMKTASAMDLARAFQEGVNTAYKAVMKPVEGTILTVAREGAKTALSLAKNRSDIIEVLEGTIESAKRTLQKTPDMLPVLKQAGVVDAGGSGLIIILEGALASLEGKAPAFVDKTPPEVPLEKPAKTVAYTGETADIQYTYCTELMIKDPQNADLDALRRELSPKGDSLLVVGDAKLIKIHVHTNHPGEILEHCLRFGELLNLKIENMKEQHRNLLNISPEEIAQSSAAEPGVGVVAVAAGTGLTEIFKSLGVASVVSGGQSMNPSTEDLLKAVAAVPKQKVVILPNNKNIILAAEQAKELSDKEVAVVPTRSIPQGISAMLAFNPERELAENANNMAQAAKGVTTGQVTFAVRDSVYNGVEIREGDILGLVNDQIVTAGQDRKAVLLEVVKQMITDDSELITLYYGEETDPAEAKDLCAALEKLYPQCEFELHDGGQPLYFYIISAE